MVAFASFRFVPNNEFIHRSKQHRHSITFSVREQPAPIKTIEPSVMYIVKQGSERCFSCFTQTNSADDEEAVPQSWGTAVRTKPQHTRALNPSEHSWFSHEHRSR